MDSSITSSNQTMPTPNNGSYHQSGIMRHDFKSETPGATEARIAIEMAKIAFEKDLLLGKQQKLVPRANFLNKVAKCFPIIGAAFGLGAVGTSIAALILVTDDRSKVELSAVTVGLVVTSLVFLWRTKLPVLFRLCECAKC